MTLHLALTLLYLVPSVLVNVADSFDVSINSERCGASFFAEKISSEKCLPKFCGIRTATLNKKFDFVRKAKLLTKLVFDHVDNNNNNIDNNNNNIDNNNIDNNNNVDTNTNDSNNDDDGNVVDDHNNIRTCSSIASGLSFNADSTTHSITNSKSSSYGNG